MKLLGKLGETGRLLIEVSVFQGLTAVVTFLVSVVIARLFDQEVLGIFSYTFGLAAFLTTFTEFGTKTSLSKMLMLDKQIGLDILKKSLCFIIPLSLFISAVALWIGKFQGNNPAMPHYNLLFVSYMVLLTIFSALLSMMRGYGKFKSSVAYTLINRFLLLIMISGLGLVTQDPFWVIVSLSITLLVLMPTMIGSISEHLNRSTSKMDLIKFIKTSVLFLLITISLFSLHYIDRVLVKYIGTFADLGYYTAYYNIANLLKLLAGLIPIIIVPLAVKKRYQLGSSLKKLALFSAPPALALGFLSGWIVPLLYGQEYALQDWVLPWSLVLASVLLLFYSYFNSILVGENPTSKQLFRIVLADALLSITLPLVLSWLLFHYTGLALSAVPLAISLTLIIKLLHNVWYINTLRAKTIKI